MGLKEAVERALHHENLEYAATFWSDSLSSSGKPASWGGVRFGTRLVDSRTTQVSVPPALAFAPIQRIGGSNGWYFANLLWQVRGFFDLLVGGVGLRRGRRDPNTLVVGDALDFWRVESFEPDRRLGLVAEMKVPGRAWLQFEVEPTSHGSVIRQTAIFDPAGLGGLLYWYALYPIHYCIFKGMLHQIAAIAQRGQPQFRPQHKANVRRSILARQHADPRLVMLRRHCQHHKTGNVQAEKLLDLSNSAQRDPGLSCRVGRSRQNNRIRGTMPDLKARLLIVDDEPSTRTLLSQIFGNLGHPVRAAEDGFSALEQIREEEPDILLSDLNMP